MPTTPASEKTKARHTSAKCKACSGDATIHAFDYGDGRGTWWCDACRRLIGIGFTVADLRKAVSR